MKLTARLKQFALNVFLATGLASLATAASDAPNFILMYIDDLGWADTSVPMMDSEPESKSDFYQTPHLEELAARGMRFSNAYAPAPTCTPSRKSIQFGKTPGRLQYTFVHDVLALKRNLTWVDEVSMADVLKDSGKGYVTAHFGKGMAAREYMNQIGYDVTDEYDVGSNGNFHGDYVDIKSRTPLPEDDPKRMRSLKKSSVDFVREHAGKNPFFMMISHYAVHVPHAASPELIEKYRNSPRGKHLKDEDYLPEDQISDGMKNSHWRLQYAAMIDEIDQGLGALVDELEAAGELDNTYIIYTSDNGGGMRPNGPLGWGKAQLYEGGLRVPMVVAGPGVKENVQCDVPVVQWDYLATIHDLAGVSTPLPDDLDGGSLRGVLEQGNAAEVERPVEGMVFHYPCYFAPPMSVIRVGDYKYMKHLLTGETQLFNLKNDYSEKFNLAREMPEKAAELDKILGDYLVSIDAEDVQDVYQARLEELDHFEAQSREIFARESALLDPDADADEIAQQKTRLDDNLLRFEKNREEVAVYRTSSHWAGGPPSNILTSTSPSLVADTSPSLVADIPYTDSGSDHLWSNSDNWQGSNVPSDSSTGAANSNDGTQLEIPSGTNAVCRGFMLGMYGSSNSAVVAGGTLACNWLDIGRSNQNGGNGTLTINSGSATVSGTLSIPNQNSSNTDPANIGQGQLYLAGGSISANSIQIGNGQNGADGGIGSISITGGSLIINGDARVQLQNYIDAGYITTAAQQSFELDYDISNSGKTTLKSTGVFNGVVSSPYPAEGSIECAVNVNSLRWTGVAGADSYKVYFGTSTTPPLVANLDSSTRTYVPSNLEDNQVYHWHVDAIQGATTNVGADWSFATNSGDDCDRVAPPFTDYCVMLSQEIQGKKHGFLAGNKTYYIGGFTPSWNISGYDTIGFTHPFHNDLRSRGYGMVQDPDTGYGHDLSGWEFYKHTKVAYGTVIVNGVRYENPVPTAMYWRPDRMICEYQVAGINIREDKYIALNDTACSIITSDQPVTLEFAGQSFYQQGITQSTNATCNFDATNNAVHIVDGGVNLVKPTQGNQVPGVMMYDGMSTIISASKPIQNYNNTAASTGQQFYTFTVPCDADGLSLTWAMHDDSNTAIAETQTVLAAPQAQLQTKTDYMNDLLNNQIPYFRCSDQDIVNVYYFLWAIHMMYYIDLSDEDPDFYPHTQTAVNNFLGIHRYDAAMQIPVGSWTVDKASFANGNALRWKTMLEHADLSTGRIPADNLGKTWYSGLMGGVTSHVSGAWQIYQHSGDLNFLSEAYGFYRALMWDAMPGFWGRQYEAADCLGFMALELGYPQSEADHWQTVVNSANFDNWFNYGWTNHGLTNIFTFANPNSENYNGLGWSSFGYMLTKGFPNDKARAMVETWAVDGPTGFLSDANGHLSTGLLAVRPRNDWDKISENAFFITPDTNAFMLLGMFATNVDDHATKFALEHLKNYNMKWGIPTAPEAINRSYELFGDQYSNFNAGKILVILEGIFGLSYSVVDSTFTVADNLPLEWDYMETYVPIGDNNNVEWTHVRVERIPGDHRSTKRIQVQNNTQQSLRIQPWLENKSLIKAPGNYSSQPAPGHIAYQIEGSSDTTLELKLSESDTAELLAESLRLTNELQASESEISIQFGISSAATDTTVILKRATELDGGNFEEIYRFDTSDQSESMAPGVHSNVTPNYFTITDELQPEGSAYYKVFAE